MSALGAEGTGSNSRVPDKIDGKFEPLYNWFMPILDDDRRREYQRLYHLKTWNKRKGKNKSLKRRREQNLVSWLKEYKKSIICEVCGESYAGCLDFHHRNPKEKVNTISDLVAKGYGKKDYLERNRKMCCSV
jgi:hypothetical protein